jgi:YHS domain-containing protein
MLVPVPQREIALLLEDLGRGGGLGPVRHRPRRDDPGRKLGVEPDPLSLEAASGSGVGVRHGAIVQVVDRLLNAGRRQVFGRSFRGRWQTDPMTTEIDPVCGMEVDTTTTDLKLEHDGTVYWFCGRGCYLEFRDDPERFLDPDHTPSM